MKYAALCLLAATACSNPPEVSAVDSAVAAIDSQPDARPAGYDAWAAVCDKHYGDEITAKLCAGSGPPSIHSLTELELQLGITRNTATLSLTGLSTGIGIRSVTPLNPRAILIKEDALTQHFIAFAFARGEPLVELVANDPVAQTLRFFVVKFHLPCEATSCTFADLLTPTIESNWTGYDLYDSDAFVNTPLDCNTCHQPGGPGTPKILRMQERLGPWMHWFGLEDRADLFYVSHELEPNYAGVPIDRVTTSPSQVEFLLNEHGFAPQPNEFVSQTILAEIGGHTGTGNSPTWQQLYNAAVQGNAIPPPYFAVDQTSPTAAQAMRDAYHAVMAGTLPRDQLPDIRAIVRDDALPAMSIRPKVGLDGRGILIHMCSQCHNGRLDQTLTRARFNVMALDTMSRQERDLAIARLELPDTSPEKMPPPRFRTLSDAERALAVGELSR